MSDVMVLKRFLGYQPGQTLQEFSSELKQPSDRGKAELAGWRGRRWRMQTPRIRSMVLEAGEQSKYERRFRPMHEIDPGVAVSVDNEIATVMHLHPESQVLLDGLRLEGCVRIADLEMTPTRRDALLWGLFALRTIRVRRDLEARRQARVLECLRRVRTTDLLSRSDRRALASSVAFD